MRGSVQDSVAYCSKEDANFFEWGTRPESGGKSKALVEAIKAVEGGENIAEMAVSGKHGEALVKFNNGLKNYRNLRQSPRDPGYPPIVIWIYGPTGTGKSRFAWDLMVNLFGLRGVWLCNTSNLQWFDGYDSHPGAIFDDFRAKGVSFNYVLRVADRYPLQVPFKGGFATWNPKLIIFTTSKSIEETFRERNQHIPEDIQQLKRRVHLILSLPTDEEKTTELLRKSLCAEESWESIRAYCLEQRELSTPTLEPELPHHRMVFTADGIQYVPLEWCTVSTEEQLYL